MILVENTNLVFTLRLLLLRTRIRHLPYDYYCFLFKETLFQRKTGPLSARTGRSPSGTAPSCCGRADSLAGLSEQALCLTSIDLPTGGRSTRLCQRWLSILPKSFKKELEGRSQEGREGRDAGKVGVISQFRAREARGECDSEFCSWLSV